MKGSSISTGFKVWEGIPCHMTEPTGIPCKESQGGSRWSLVWVSGGTVLAAFGAEDGAGYYKVIEGLLINSLQRELQGARSDLGKKWGRGDSLWPNKKDGKEEGSPRPMRDPVSNQRWKRPEEQPPRLSAYHTCMHWYLSPPPQTGNIHYKLGISPMKIFYEEMMEITILDLSKHDGGTDLGNAYDLPSWQSSWFPSRIHVALSAIKGFIPQDQDQCKHSARGKLDFT